MKKNESGFGVVGILVLVVIIALTGAVGWLVWSKQKGTATNNATPSSGAVQTPKNSESIDKNTHKPVIPEGWVQQTDSITGVKYAVPKELSVKDPNNTGGVEVAVQNKSASIQTSEGETIFNEGTFSANKQQWVLNDGKGTLNSEVKQTNTKIQDEYVTWYTHFGEGIGGGAYYQFSLYTFVNDKLYTVSFKANACDETVNFEGDHCTKKPYNLVKINFDDIRNQFVKTVVIPSVK